MPGARVSLAAVGVFLLGTLFLSGCSSFSSEGPALPDSTFTRVLVETHLMTARSRLETAFPPALPDSILQRYDVDRNEVDATLRHYSEHPGEFASLYNSVIDTLNAIRQRRSRSASPTSDTTTSDERTRGRDE